MTELQEIRERITVLKQSADTTLRLYPVLKVKDGNDEIRLADITDDASDELKDMLLDYLMQKFVNNVDLYYTNLTDADERKNSAYCYDIDGRPGVLSLLTSVLDNGQRQQFSFDDDAISNIIGFVITIGNVNNHISLYKRHFHLSTMKADKSFSIFKSGNRFVKMKEDILKLSGHVDFLQINNDLIVINLKALEDSFGYEEVIRKQASINIASIEAFGLLDDVAPLIEMVQDLKQAKKILRIKTDSPVMQLPVKAIIDFVKQYRPIMKKFKLSEDGTMLKLDTLVSKRLFLTLMNDDFLTSELTKLYYAGLAKDKMDIEEELEDVN